MDKISFKRFIKYWGFVFVRTILNIQELLLELKDNFMSTIILFLLYFVAIYAASLGLLGIDSVDAVFGQFGSWAQLATMLLLILLTFMFRFVFLTPVELYYEKKKIVDKGNWDDVDFVIRRPESINLMGWAITVRNRKLTPIENLSMWITGATPKAGIRLGKNKRFGHVNDYETDKDIIFSSVDLLAGQDATFVIANYDLSTAQFMIRARDANLSETSEIEVQKESSHVLDIQYRAEEMPAKTIRYSLDLAKDASYFSRYQAKSKPHTQ